MSVSSTVKALIEVTKVFTDKDKRKALLTIIAVPSVFVIMVSSMFFYRSDDENETFILSVTKLKSDMEIENELDGDLIRCVYMLHTSTISENISEVKTFLLNYFCKEETITVIVDDKGNDDPADDETYDKKIILFLSFDEIMERVKQEPFLFTSQEVEMLQYFKPYPELQIDDNFVAPCIGVITSPFGTRIHPISGEVGLHTGIDISGKWHQPIMSITDGEIVNVNTATSGYGNYITIKHTVNNQTFYSFYAHLSSISVSVGQMVTKGQAIGLEGGNKSDNNPGTSTGHHLHFELRQNEDGDFLNPQNIFKLKG